MRQVLRPGGTVAVAVWDESKVNPWATIPNRAMVKLGHAAPPPEGGPGMFALAARGRLAELLEEAGFVEPVVETVEIERTYEDIGAFVAETSDLSQTFGRPFRALDETGQHEVAREIAVLAEPFTGDDGSIVLPGRSLVAAAKA